MGKKQDQSKMSRQEVKNAKKKGVLSAAAKGATSWFKKYIERNWSKQAYTRLCKSAKARGISSIRYVEQVLLK